MVGLRPDGGTEPEHDVAAEESGEEHDLGREEQPHDELSLREGQPRLILEHDVTVATPVVVVPMGIAIVVAVGDRRGGGIHGRVWMVEGACRRRGGGVVVKSGEGAAANDRGDEDDGE